jgi:hypothetical protein
VEHTTRSLRRMAGLLAARLPELSLQEVADPRSRRGRRWKLRPLLTVALLSLLSGGRSTADAERLSARLSRAVRRRLGIGRRVPDTTLRDLLCQLDSAEIRGLIHRYIAAADRRKALHPEGLPFGVVAMDGKSVTIESWDSPFVQRHVPDHGRPFGLLRTITCALVSARGAPCLDAIPVPGSTSEGGAFCTAFEELVRVHGGRFQLITYDAGAASGDNAAAVVSSGKDYLFALKNDQPLKLRTARWLLEGKPVVASTDDTLSNQRSVVRKLRLASVGMLGTTYQPIFWSSTKTIVEVTSETYERGTLVAREERLFLSSLVPEALTPEQWLHVVRRHWGVENDCHRIFDIVFEEDDRPWIDMAPQGTLSVLLLRRLAYNLLSLFRSVTQRSDEKRAMPWKELVTWVEWTLLVAVEEHFIRQDARKVTAVCN